MHVFSTMVVNKCELGAFIVNECFCEKNKKFDDNVEWKKPNSICFFPVLPWYHGNNIGSLH